MDIPVLPGSRRLLGTAVDEPNLGQKPKLGGVRALLPFHCIFSWFAFVFLKFFPVLLCSFNLQKTQKYFSFLLLSLNLEKPKKNMSFALSLLCFRVQLESVM